MSKDLKQIRELCGSQRKEHSRKREALVLRTSGRNVPEMFKEQPGGHCDWSMLCKAEEGNQSIVRASVFI